MAHWGDPVRRIRDINQSPFNVGLHLVLSDFGVQEIADLELHHWEPLGTEERWTRNLRVVWGNPQKVRRAFYEMVAEGRSLEDIENRWP